jgi:hypothetical protein
MHLQASLDANQNQGRNFNKADVEIATAAISSSASTQANAGTTATATSQSTDAMSINLSGAAAPAAPTAATALAPGVVVVANAPVRIDIAGGWSDTPPNCYETAGAVSIFLIVVILYWFATLYCVSIKTIFCRYIAP